MNPTNKGTENDRNGDATQERFLFFNYHEYSVKNYKLTNEQHEDIHEQSLVITHFPNPYVPKDSLEFKETRVVRIPRTFNSKGALFPEFSTSLPGNEAAAIFDGDSSSFIIKGEHRGQLFGTSSTSPLSMLLSDQEFKLIIEHVNMLLKEAYNPWTMTNVIWFLLEVLSLRFLGNFVTSPSKRVSSYSYVI